MVKFILKRIGTMIIAMFMIILITFTLMHSIPGGPFTNTKGGSIDNGVLLDSAPYALLLVMALSGGAVLLLRRRAHRS